MEDVSKSLVAQMADCIKTNLEANETAAAGTTAEPGTAAPNSTETPGETRVTATAKPVNAFALLWSVLVARLRRLFSRSAA
jgi:hypothetical protein